MAKKYLRNARYFNRIGFLPPSMADSGVKCTFELAFAFRQSTAEIIK
jgi:hypothetical protein